MTSVAYTFTIAPGELSKQGLYLLRSIRQNTGASKEEVFVYIVQGEKEDIKDEVLNEVKMKATIIEGSMPNPDYPLSAAHGALRETSKTTDKEFLLLLDTDTVVLDDIDIHEKSDADLFLTPEVTSNKFWASREKSEDVFREIFSRYGFTYPEKDLRGNYDGEKINPYYNGGFILTKNNDFPERFLELCRSVHGDLPKQNYHSEMVALALLASDYKVKELGPEYNFFQAIRPYPQEGTKVVHYVDLRALHRGVILSRKIGSGWFADKLEGTGVLEDLGSKNVFKKYLDFLLELNVAYNRRIKGRELLNYKARKVLIRGLEITNTKQLARDVANWILGKEKFKEKSY